MGDDRRSFLKKSAALVGSVSLGRCAPGEEAEETATGAAGPTEVDLDAGLVRAVAEAVLPVSDLGDDGLERAVTGFREWVAGFEPEAERPHGYLYRELAEIRYGPPHPGPRWAGQLESLEAAARQRHQDGLAGLDVPARRRLIEERLRTDELEGIPEPGRARHVAVGLMGWFYDRPEATNLCYGRRIDPYGCRGLDTVGDEPEPLDAGTGSRAALDRRAPGSDTRDHTFPGEEG